MFCPAPWLSTISPVTFRDDAVWIFLIISSSNFSKSTTIWMLFAVEPSLSAMNLLERKALTQPWIQMSW